MSQPRMLNTPLDTETICSLQAGDRILLSGTLVTGRDVAHRRMYEAIQEGRELPVNLEKVVLFYAAPTPASPGRVIGSIGPTTSGRMDRYTPLMMEKGLRVMVGKGTRSPEVRDAIKHYRAVYFGASGGVAALLAASVRSARVIAYEDAGPEAMMALEVVNFPVVVINDCLGGDLYGDSP